MIVFVGSPALYALFLLFPRYAYLGNGYLMGHGSGARKTKFLGWDPYVPVGGCGAAGRWDHVSMVVLVCMLGGG